jgi:hypothetical protein
MKPFAFVNNPKVVCLEDSLPTGTMSFNFSKQYLRCARLIFEQEKEKSMKISINSVTRYLLIINIPAQQFNLFILHTQRFTSIDYWLCNTLLELCKWFKLTLPYARLYFKDHQKYPVRFLLHFLEYVHICKFITGTA